MRRIYKWPLSPTTTVPWSPDDKVLLVADQGGGWPTLWAEQEDERPAHHRAFTICATGQIAPSDLEHIGSAVCDEFVWHVYAEPLPVASERAGRSGTATNAQRGTGD